MTTFNTQSTDLIEMIAIQVSIYPEQSTNHGFDSFPEVPRKGHTPNTPELLHSHRRQRCLQTAQRSPKLIPLLVVKLVKRSSDGERRGPSVEGDAVSEQHQRESGKGQERA